MIIHNFHQQSCQAASMDASWACTARTVQQGHAVGKYGRLRVDMIRSIHLSRRRGSVIQHMYMYHADAKLVIG